jgi:hypothetical protein
MGLFVESSMMVACYAAAVELQASLEGRHGVAVGPK